MKVLNRLSHWWHPQLGPGFEQARADGELWGRRVETAVGAVLINTAPPGLTVTGWRDRHNKVDFVLRHGTRVVPVEVKTSRTLGAVAAPGRFSQTFGVERGLGH